MTSCEDQRASLERLEVIEDAISSRIRRNPEIYYRLYQKLKQINFKEPPEHIASSKIQENKIFNVKKSRRSKKQIAFQQHEINQFLEEYERQVSSLMQTEIDIESLRDDKLNFEAFDKEIELIKDIPENNLEATASLNEYALFSSSTSTQKNISSIKSQNLDINSIFNREESYGDFLDLEKYHQQWLNVVKDASVTMIQFLNTLARFQDNTYLILPAIDRNGARYHNFVHSLVQYVSNYFYKCYPLVNTYTLDQHLDNLFEEYINQPVTFDNRGYFCISCGKLFKSDTIYKSHIPGKKHQKNRNTKSKFLIEEFRLHKFLTFLNEEFSNTKNLVERKLAFTADERAQEMDRLSAEYDAPIYGENEVEDHTFERTTNKSEVEINEMENMPLGPDGFPIPHWLYKLQGLDIEYPCEICGNYIYKGRRQFDKHFTQSRHVFGLRCLGIEPSSTFKGITDIQEAKDLNSGDQRPTATQSAAKKLEVEVEDDEGNVMSEKVYLELKKQGLY
ncbi:LAFE_0E02894g1_1 [Lachancea fermentati]|uniref:LAFE_0E02894g1_1 n=1 Tax=Lachancea fermentati TaxID=4955 RepID=A0A1G4MCZ6_LACFM|nr:LAFE_0E02894g1_1 [Lachancea fermentati]